MKGSHVADIRINHVAMSMPESAMDEATRADIERFYGEVYGWTPYTPEGESGSPLVMLMSDPKLFLFVMPEKDGMIAPPLDHFGIEVFEESELDEMLGRAKTFQDKDDRVRIIDKAVKRYTADPELRPDLAGSTGVDLVSCYIGYILPMMVEIQYFR
jgi:hypothetical protein